MCGLIFRYQQGSSAQALKASADSALNKLVHRGPDDRGLVCEPPFVIGHRRLSIIDLSASRQPIADETGRYLLAYNGEVYNYKTLRARLEPHWQFRTQGDTEVVLAGLIVHGTDFLRDMEGMWALSLWDKVQSRLFLARDRMGKKPLYFTSDAQGFACASELNALRELSPLSWREDLDSTADYLRYGFYLPGTSAYKDIFEVLPGHTLHWQPGGNPEQAAYWSLPVGQYAGSQQHARRELRERLIDAVEKRLVADVEVCAFLSGGVDSSLIVAILTGCVGVRPKTFTIGFSEASFDERPFARNIAERCATEHYEECLTAWDADKLKALIFDHVGQPFADASLLPTALVSQLAARHVKVSLSGDGGDELFSGYQRYQARAIMRWYMRLPAPLRSNLRRVIRALPEPMSHHSRSLLKKAHLFQGTVDRQQSETPYIAPLFCGSAEFAALAPDLADKGHKAPGLPAVTGLDDVQAMMAADAVIYLPQDILTKVDRASMAYSLEARAPFLDSRLIELAFSLPRKWHRRGIAGKRLLRESFSELLPNDIWNRRKQGFGVPVHQWFREALGGELKKLLMQVDSPLNKEKVMHLLCVHEKGIRDHGNWLWNLYIYLLWRQRHFS